MNKSLLLIIISIFCYYFVLAQKHIDLPLVPDSLLKQANSIIHSYTVDVVIKNDNELTQESKKVITVLNNKAEEETVFVDYEDDFRKITEATISVYDGKGNLLKTYKKKQMEKVKYNDGFSLVTDDKLYYFDIPINRYPVTIVIEKKIVQNAFLDVLDIVLDEPNQAIIAMQFKYTLPLNNTLRFFNKQLLIQPTITQTTNAATYFFNLANVKPFVKDSTNTKKEFAQINIAPTYFEMDKYKGDFSSWQTFGNWYYTLCNQKNDLSETAKNEIKNIVVGVTNHSEKVNLLYKYLQNNFRYVNVSLGIGGFRPFAASFVHKNKYGDCKALSNYMQAILKTVGIESNQVLISAGNNYTAINPSFVANTFNHVIVCVPNNNDTIWLECTSNSNSYNVLGAFTENRLALAITPKGGVLIHTPNSTAIQNTLYTNTLLTINEDWSADARTNYVAMGEFMETIEQNIWKSNESAQTIFLRNYMEQKAFDRFEVLPKNNTATSINYFYNKIYDFKASKKYFIKTQLYNLNSNLLPKTAATSFEFKNPFIKSDTLIVILPQNCTIENKSKKVIVPFANGEFNYEMLYNEKENYVKIITNFKVTKTKVEDRNMNSFVIATQQIKQLMQESIVLIKQ